jgi:hypothetical protein
MGYLTRPLVLQAVSAGIIAENYCQEASAELEFTSGEFFLSLVARKELAMSAGPAFADALETVERLDPEAQAELISVLSRRLAERGRERVAASVAEARQEFARGECVPMTAADIVREAQS